MVIIMPKGLFSNSIEPACRHCIYGHLSNSEKKILCVRWGVVEPEFRCKKYQYDPLKRVPMRTPPLPEFEKDDFDL